MSTFKKEYSVDQDPFKAAIRAGYDKQTATLAVECEKKLDAILIPWKEKRAKENGELLFKAHTEMGLPYEIAEKIIFESETILRNNVISKLKEGIRHGS